MSDRIVQAAQNLAERMPVDEPWNRATFLEVLAEQRGRPIQLVPVTSDVLSSATSIGHTCGLWIVREDDDLILYGGDMPDYHVEQVITHEAGHMVLGHVEKADADATPTHSFRDSLHHLADSKILSMLGRSSYEDMQERDAERFADLVMVEALTVRQRRRSRARSTFFRNR